METKKTKNNNKAPDVYNASEEKFKMFLNEAVDGIFHGDANWNFVSVNSKGCEMSGYTEKELLKLNINVLFSEEERLKVPLRYDLLENGETVISERELTRKDGTTTFIEMYSKKISKSIYQSIFRDISKRKSVENELKNSEAMYRTIFENTGTATVIIDERTIIVLANSETEKLTGYTKEELEGKISWTIFIDSGDLEKMKEYNARRREGYSDVPKHYEFKFIDRSGNLKNIFLTIDLIPGTKRSVASLLDITDFKNRELELIDSEIRYRNLVESFHDMVFITDYNNRMLYVNPSMVLQTGYSIHDFYNEDSNIRFVHQDDEERVINHINSFIKSEDRYSTAIENKFCAMYGKIVWHSTVISKVIYQGIPGLQFICHDITERKENENKLKHAKIKAEESDKLKSAFLANMSHEIRTPMNAIIGFAGLLDDESLSDEQKSEFVKIIQSSGNQLMTLINDIIDISKIEAGQMRISKAICQLSQVLQDLYSSYSSDLILKKKSDITLTLNIENSCENLNFITDETRLKQILTNLLSNAVKFTQHGSIELGCKIYNKDYLLFSVVDTGIGISKHLHRIIFEPFRQADISHSHHYGGTGLGLSISKNLVDLMEGKMWMESKKGEGSAFYFTVPYKGITKNQVKNLTDENSFNINWKNKTILITEDEISNFKYLQELLLRTGAKIIMAESGEKAIEICTINKNIDLILIDIRLPGINGVDATKIIKSINSNVPIIAQTAYAYLEDKEKCIEAGCVDFLSKPIQSVKLYEAITKVFERV